MNDIRREEHETLNGDRPVLMSEFLSHTNHVLEAIGSLTREISSLNRRLTRQGSLPDLSGDEDETTGVHELRARLDAKDKEAAAAKVIADRDAAVAKALADKRASEDAIEKVRIEKRADQWRSWAITAIGGAIAIIIAALALRLLHV